MSPGGQGRSSVDSRNAQPLTQTHRPGVHGRQRRGVQEALAGSAGRVAPVEIATGVTSGGFAMGGAGPGQFQPRVSG